MKRQACNFIKKEIPTQVFSFEFCKIFGNTFAEHLRKATSWYLANIKIRSNLPRVPLLGLRNVILKKTIIMFIFIVFMVNYHISCNRQSSNKYPPLMRTRPFRIHTRTKGALFQALPSNNHHTITCVTKFKCILSRYENNVVLEYIRF